MRGYLAQILSGQTLVVIAALEQEARGWNEAAPCAGQLP
jgi:hypothetical protein